MRPCLSSAAVCTMCWHIMQSKSSLETRDVKTGGKDEMLDEIKVLTERFIAVHHGTSETNKAITITYNALAPSARSSNY